MVEQQITPETLKNFSVIENERILLQIGLVITLYIEEAHTPEKREGLIQCFDDYWSLCGLELHQASVPHVSNRWINLDKKKLPPVRNWVNELSENHPWSITCTGSENTADASAFNMEILCSAAWEKDLSYVTATLPFVWFSNNEGSLPELLLKWCEWTSAYHGYAGIGIIPSLESNYAKKAEPMIYELAKRFPGLEVDNPVSHLLYLKDGIKGVNWLTVLGTKFLEKIGGRGYLKNQLTTEFELLDYKDGLVIKAGLQPQFGDIENNNIPEHYRTISRLLKPIRVEYPVAIQHGHQNQPTLDKEGTKEWFARFD